MVALILFVLITFGVGCVVVGAVVADARRRGLSVLPLPEPTRRAAVPAAAVATATGDATAATRACTDGAGQLDHGHRTATA